MKKGIIYKTLVTIEILSEEPINSLLSLEDINYEITEGSMSGRVEYEASKKVTGKKAVELIKSQASDPEFFWINDEGNSTL